MGTTASVVNTFSIKTPFSQDDLLLVAMSGEEKISGPFLFHLQLTSKNDGLESAQILGKNICITITLPNGQAQYINGVVTRFSQGSKSERFTTYFAEVRPWFWLLTLQVDHQIFQNKTVPQIMEQVFSSLGYSDYKNALTGTYQPREFCVQYGETTFNFLSRLMESEGIFYFFQHSDAGHTLVFTDNADAYMSLPGIESIRFRQTGHEWQSVDAMIDGEIAQELVPGKYSSDDYNFETPSTELLTVVSGQSSSYSIYQYPGIFQKKNEGESLANIRLTAFEVQQKLLRGKSMCSAFHAGCKFTLADHFNADANTSYILRSVTHDLHDEIYSNHFEAFPAAVIFRPLQQTPVPRIYGAQTALVVGKAGEEIWTDQYGRIKVKFHWDQSSAQDETSSCWIRVAQGWAGKQWGNIFLPRIGQEVVVSFLEGNPDRPIVTGCVYNAEQVVPYTLPDEQTKSTMKTNSSKGGQGSNEIRFEDKKGSEELFLQAQKDMNVTVLNDQTITIQNNRTVTVSEKDEKLTVAKGNRTIQVSTGNETHEVKGTRDVTVTGKESHTNKADYDQSVSGNFTLKVSGNLTLDVNGSITIKSGTSLGIKAGTSLTNESGTSLTNKAGTSMSNEAATSISSKANASHSVESSGMLELKGSLVKIN